MSPLRSPHLTLAAVAVLGAASLLTSCIFRPSSWGEGTRQSTYGQFGSLPGIPSIYDKNYIASYFVNSGRQPGSLGVESLGNRVALIHNGGRFYDEGVHVANVTGVGEPASAMLVSMVPLPNVPAYPPATTPELPPKNLFAVAALEASTPKKEKEDGAESDAE